MDHMFGFKGYVLASLT